MLATNVDGHIYVHKNERRDRKVDSIKRKEEVTQEILKEITLRKKSKKGNGYNNKK